ncbi:hypothetical protein MPSEU_000062000 [Mayamaea pseudoterrestris]|nr:hypothetical protein MPSEU_000062000 [Mayamaea pseudoterrestris]
MPPYAATLLETAVVSPSLKNLHALEMQLSSSSPSLSSLSLASPPSTSSSTRVNDVQSVPSVGAPVLTAFGMGTVQNVSATTTNTAAGAATMISVTLDSWTLANNSKVTCYLRRQDVTVLGSVSVETMTVEQTIEYAKLCKDLGVAAQQHGKLHGTALLLHETALAKTQSVLKQCSAKERPNLFLGMVKGYNHAASCALQLDLQRKARDHAKNAIAVLDALEKKGQIHSLLQQQQQASSPSSVSSSSSSLSEDAAAIVGRVKLFGECRCKSLILVARSYLEQANCKQRHRDLAKQHLDQASVVIKKYTSKEYTQLVEMKPVLRQFVSHKRNVTKYRMMAKMQKEAALSSNASLSNNHNDSSSYSKWFANKRVWFADDGVARANKQQNSNSSGSRANGGAAHGESRAGWSQTVTSAVAYTGFVALGALMVHQIVMSRRK